MAAVARLLFVRFRGKDFRLMRHPSPTGPVARLVVAGDPLPMKLPASLPKPPLETIANSEITGRRTLTWTVIHLIDEKSPLHGVTAATLAAQHAERSVECADVQVW